MILRARLEFCIHLCPAALCLFDLVYVRLLNVTLNVATKVILIDVQLAPIALDDLLVGEAFAVMKKQDGFSRV